MPNLTTKEDIAVIYASLGLIGSLVGMAFAGEEVGKDEITKLVGILDVLLQRAEQLEAELGETSA